MLKYYITTLLLITCLCGLIYGAVQHVLRTEANDPQIQIAEDTAEKLAKGQPALSVTSPTKIDIAKSLSPFLIVYDANGQPVASSGLINGQIPWLPSGVLQEVQQNGEDRITWQPQSDVRIAAVIVGYSGNTNNMNGFVLAGRSLREVEISEDTLLQEIGLAWIIAIIIATIPFFLEIKKQKIIKKTKIKKRVLK